MDMGLEGCIEVGKCCEIGQKAELRNGLQSSFLVANYESQLLPGYERQRCRDATW